MSMHSSGLLDQMACAVGGLITIDFVEPSAPVVEKIDFDFGSQNHSLIIVQTGKGHADLSADYSSARPWGLFPQNKPVEGENTAPYQ